MSIITQNEGKSITINPGAEIVASTVQEFRNELQVLVLTSPKELIVDLTNTKMIDSMGLGTFITAYNSLRQIGSEFKVTNVNDDLLSLFKAMRLDKHFPVIPVKEAA